MARRLTREHNDRAWLAWHTANLTAYAPPKGRDFIRLEKLTMTPSVPAQRKRSWEADFAAVAAWAMSHSKGK